MSQPNSDPMTRDRLAMTLIGAAAGVTAWVLIEVLPEFVQNERLMMLIALLSGGFFSAFLAAIGPLRYTRAAVAAAIAALPAGVLLFGASFRFTELQDFLETGHPIFAYSTIIIVGLPFLIVAQRPQEGWRNYSALFTQAWNIVVRYAAAWVFVGVVWGVIMLSNALFKLVGLSVIEVLLDFDLVPYLITGAVLGLALAVVVELSDYISPYLILRLLRLLLPAILLVTLVFLVALPIQGLNNLFGGLSAAATLMAMAIGIATLITSALDRSAEEATESRILQLSARALALALPVLAAISVYSVYLRVQSYGWTPTRMAAISAALVLLGYGGLYALAVLRGANWMARIRSANVGMALVTIALAVLWLNPFLSPERISARDQLARLLDGRTAPDKADLWYLGRDLGTAGAEAIRDLAATTSPDHAMLRADVARLETASSRYQFRQKIDEKQSPGLQKDLRALLSVLPSGREIPDTLLEGMTAAQLDIWINSCERKTPAGQPGCLLLEADLFPQEPGVERILIRQTPSGGVVFELAGNGDAGTSRARLVQVFGDGPPPRSEVIDQIREGAFRVGPVDVQAITIGETPFILKR